MGLLTGAKLSSRGRHFSVLQQLNFYSSKTTPPTPKSKRLTSTAGAQKPEPTKNLTVSMLDWPKPTDIPYQERVANSVNLIGRVKTPVQLDSANPDGNHFATALISQEYGGGSSSSLLIPVVFEGDLAHVVACHVRENDSVFVSGQLSMVPTRFSFSEGLGKLHIVGENLNFVEGFAKYALGQKPGIEKPLDEEKSEEMVTKDEEFNQNWKGALENAKVKKFSGENDWAPSSATKQPEEENDHGKSVVESAKKNSVSDLWKDLLESPKQWWDYRGHKLNGLVKERFPDFKHKESRVGLWVDSAPSRVLTDIVKLEFDVKFMQEKPAPDGQGLGEKEFSVEFGKAKESSQRELSWKDLVENPKKWWDNRLNKRNPRSPDFKHKTTGEALWLSDSPDWVLSRLSDCQKNREAL